jgi:hypothetical protein
MKYIFLLYLVLILIISSQAHALTVSNSKYSTELMPGSTDAFTMTLNPDNSGEIGIPLTVGMDEGNCSGWVTPDKTGITLSSGDSVIKASIAVPVDARNGLYKCYVQYTTPPKGTVRSQIQVPITVIVGGGEEAPAPVPTIQERTTLTAPVNQAPPVPEESFVTHNMIPVGGVAGALFAVFGIVTYYDIRRAKK